MRSGRVVDEPLIVVPVRHLRAANLAQGFDPSPEPILATVLKPNVARVMPRSVAEADPRFKQIVCYVIVRSQGLVFHYLRSAGAGERRLAGRRSLGLGGHLNADDADGALDHQGLQRAIQRELDEEVALARDTQLGHREGLGQEVVRPRIEALHPPGHRALGGQHQDGHRGAPLAQRVAEVQTRSVGQPEVQHHHVGLALAQGVQRRGDVPGAHHQVPVPRERPHDELAGLVVVFHHQHAHEPRG